MKVAFITRSTLLTARGGDTTQVLETARHLEMLHISVDIKPAFEKIDYQQYDLLHFFNIIRPADILHHLHKTSLPFVVSPIMVDYSEYDKHHRSGLTGFLFRFLSPNGIEYVKAVARKLRGNDEIMTPAFWWKGQKNCIKEILSKTPILLPNSDAEYEYMANIYSSLPPYIKVPDGIDPSLFFVDETIKRDHDMVICAGRIEGLKNQLTLIKALNNTKYKLYIIGNAAPNQAAYYRQCRRAAASNVFFTGHVPYQTLITYYQKAKVHVLPSWFEVCGLSSLEAAATGCNVVITNKGFTKEYFEDAAYYCDPLSASSIFNAVEQAMNSEPNTGMQKGILENYTWQKAAEKTLQAYKKVLKEWKN